MFKCFSNVLYGNVEPREWKNNAMRVTKQIDVGKLRQCINRTCTQRLWPRVFLVVEVAFCFNKVLAGAGTFNHMKTHNKQPPSPAPSSIPLLPPFLSFAPSFSPSPGLWRPPRVWEADEKTFNSFLVSRFGFPHSMNRNDICKKCHRQEQCIPDHEMAALQYYSSSSCLASCSCPTCAFHGANALN